MATPLFNWVMRRAAAREAAPAVAGGRP
jgi:hypothetical protein